MNVRDVSLILYEKIGSKFGLGRESVCGNYLIRELDPDIEAVGFPGAICLSRDGSKCVLWLQVPDDTFEPTPSVSIYTGEASTGQWAHGQGEQRQEIARIEIGYSGRAVNLQHPAFLLFIPIFIAKAAQIASGSTFRRFWDVERRPNGDFTSP